MPRPTAFFDVDGTVIAGDSFLHLGRWRLSEEPWRVPILLMLSPIFMATYLFDLDRRWAKSALLWSLTVGKRKRTTVRMLNRELPQRLRPNWFCEATSTIEDLRKKGIHICYVSASGQTWVRGLLAQTDAGPKTVIGSKLGFFFGGVVLSSPNCYKSEKIVRIKERFGDDFEPTHAYSDHPADIPMLRMAQERFVVNPHAKNIGIFETQLQKPFEIVTWHPLNQGNKTP
jgi:phosphatidylglycerophosphatase C